MAGKEITQEQLEKSVQQFCDETKGATWQPVEEDGKKQCRVLVNGDPEVFLWLESGCLRCSDPLGFGEMFNKSYILAVKTTTAQRQPRKENIPSSGQTSSLAPVVRPSMPIRDIQIAELTFEDIRQYICPAANDRDVTMFLKLCQARNLNPFTGDAYLIPFKDNKSGEIKCSMVVSKEAFMRKAELNPHYRGFKAGIILSKDGGDLIYREGTFLRHGETLEGGWSEVYRDDRTVPIRSEDSLKEYDSGKGLWASGKKETMIRKVSVAKSHREAFPSDTSGCYGAEEMGIDPANEVQGA